MRLFGRESELRILDRILADCESENGALLLISGEPGIGKTALLESLVGSAKGRGFLKVQAQYARGGSSSTESPWACLIRDWSEPRGANNGTAEGSEIENLSALTSEHVSQDAVADGTPGRIAGDDSTVFAALRDALLKAAKVSPILITFDDLQDADEFSLKLLTYLGEMVSEMRIVVAGAYRSSGSSGFTDRARHRILPAIERHAHCIELTPLEDDAIEEMFRDKLQRDVEPPLVHGARKLTGGNPKLLVECEPLLSNRAELITCLPGSVRIPRGVVIAVEERLENLTVTAKQLLICGSVLGDQFDCEIAVRITETDRDEASASFHQLEKEGLLRAINGPRYEFIHGLVREVLYRGIQHDLKSSMHRRAALAMEARHAHELAEYAEPIAQNLVRSRESGVVGDALEYAQMAISRFINIGALERASAMVSLILESASGDGHRDDPRLCDILTQWGIAQREAGDLPAAERTFHQAIARAQKIGKPERLARLAVEVPDYHWPLPGSSSPLAILLAENALQSLGGKGTELLALVTARLAAELSYDRNQKKRSAELAKFALEFSEKSGTDLRLRLRILRFRDCTLRHPGDIEERLANLNKTMLLAKQLGEMSILWEVCIASVCSLFSLGKLDEAERLLPIFQQASEIANRPLYRVFTIISFAARGAISRPTDCERLFEEFRQAAEEAGIPWVVNRGWPSLILPFIEREGLVELEPMASAEIQSRRDLIVDQAMNCWLNALLGRRLEARMQLERLAMNDFADVLHCADFLAAAAVIGEACIRLADVEHHAKRIYDLLLPYANREIVLGQIAALGSTAYYLGRLANTLSNRDAAWQHFQNAAGLDLSAKCASWSLYGAFELAVVMSETRDEADGGSAASDLLLRIQTEAAQREMGVLVKRIAAFQSGVPLDVSPGRDVSSNIVTRSLTSEPDARARESAVTQLRVIKPAETRRIFRREDEFWILGYEDQISRVRHRKGLVLISRLLEKPYEAIPAVELASTATDAPYLPDGPPQRLTVTEIGPLLDSAAKRSYRERARELREELEEARKFNDLGRVTKHEEELQFLTRELAKAVGLFGRDRASGSSNERARLRVTNAIKSAIALITAHHAPLGSHLKKTIKTGFCCAYRPEVRLDWEL